MDARKRLTTEEAELVNDAAARWGLSTAERAALRAYVLTGTWPQPPSPDLEDAGRVVRRLLEQ